MKRVMSREAGSASGGKNVVIIGGGTGTSTILQGLKKYPLRLSVVVSTADDGGSTGLLRKHLNVLPPGDIRQVLVGLAKNEMLGKFFSYRFSEGELKGHTVGNLVLAGLESHYRSPEKAIEICAEILDSSGEVLPVTLKPTSLTAVLKNGKKLIGEHVIDEPQTGRSPIATLSVSPSSAVVNPKVIAAIKKADIIILSPGDLYTSLLPNLLVKGVASAIVKSKAKKIMVTNIMTKPGQTDDFSLSDLVKAVNMYLPGNGMQVVIANNSVPARGLLNRYKQSGSKLVEMDFNKVGGMGIKLIKAPLVSSIIFKKAKGDQLHRSVLRHDSQRTAKEIWKLIK